MNDKSKFSTLLEEIFLNTLPAIDFLTLCKSENKISVIEEIIKRGENNQTEFKSTLRWDIRQGIKSPAIEHASLKTVCAFLNSEGGELMIGVRDDGNIEGIETDQFNNDDHFLLHLWTLVKTCIGQEVVDWVNTSLQKFGDKTVCRVSCRKSRTPVFLRQKGFEEAFFIRVGPSTNSLEISTALKYIEQHF
jgi:predicted HTH transcriptional regulator